MKDVFTYHEPAFWASWVVGGVIAAVTLDKLRGV